MKDSVQLFLELELIDGKEAAFEEAFREISALVASNDIGLRYTFYRDPAKPSALYAIETHDDVASLVHYFEVAMPALQKARACTKPVRIMVFGDLPAEMKAMLEQDGAVVVQSWLGN